MTTFYSEALPSIDWTNPLTSSVFDSILPDINNTDVAAGTITPLIRSDVVVATNKYQFNNEGSISLLGIQNGGDATLTGSDRFSFLTESLVLILDIQTAAGSVGNQTKCIYGFNGYGNALGFWSGGYSAGINLKSQYAYTTPAAAGVNNAFIPQDGKRHLGIIYYDHLTKTVYGYDNGILVVQASFSTTANTFAHIKSTNLMPYYSNSPSNSKFFMGCTLKRAGSFTTAEIDSIIADPYQVFQTQTSINEEYSLNFTIAAHTITIPFIGAYTGTLYLTDGTTQAIPAGTGTYTLTGVIPINLLKIDGTDTTGFHLFSLNKTKGDTVTSETSILVLSLSGFPFDSGYVRNANGVINGYQFIYGTYTAFSSPWVANSEFKVIIDITPNRFGGSNDILLLTSVSFCGYWNSNFFVGGMSSQLKISPLIINQRTTITIERTGTSLTLSDSYTGNTKTINFTTQYIINAIMGISNQYPSNIHSIELIDITTPSNSRNYDFTTGDQGKIVETLQSKHATITNDSVVKWQPILPVDVFLIGSATVDYSDIPAFNTAQNASTTAAKECRLFANSVGGSISGFAKGLTFNGINKTKTITTALTLTTTGITSFNTIITGNITASGATADVIINDSEVGNVTG